MAVSIWNLAAQLCVWPSVVSSQNVEMNRWTCPHCVGDQRAADVMDLSCDTIQGEALVDDWQAVRRDLILFLQALETYAEVQDEALVARLMYLADIQLSSPKHSQCYLGMVCLGYLAMMHLDAADRNDMIRSSFFGGSPIKDQFPLSFWDILNSGWPVFQIISCVKQYWTADLVAGTPADFDYKGNPMLPPPDRNSNWDALPLSKEDDDFRKYITNQLEGASNISPRIAFRYLSTKSAGSSCGGRATAYFALVHTFWQYEDRSKSLMNATKSMIESGESAIASCGNATIYQLALMRWPFFTILGMVQKLWNGVAPATRNSFYESPPPSDNSIDLKWRYWSRELQSKDTENTTLSAVDVVGDDLTNQRTYQAGQCSDTSLHIAFSVDRGHVDGLVVALRSAIENSNGCEICMHVFYNHERYGELDFFKRAIACQFGDIDPSSSLGTWRVNASTIVLQPFAESEIGSVRSNATQTHWDFGDLTSASNYVRFSLADMLPTVERVLYLDADIVTRGDVCRARDDFPPTKMIGAVLRMANPISTYVNAAKSPIWLPTNAPSFNAGVLMLNLKLWRERNAKEVVEHWVSLNHGLWRHGSQPSLLLGFGDEVARLEWYWNVDGFGHRLNYPKNVLNDAIVLHWTGPLKPWLKDGINRKLWERYIPQYCANVSNRHHTVTCRPDSWFC